MEIEREKTKRSSFSAAISQHGYRCPHPSSAPWSSEWVVHSPLQAEAYRLDPVIAATAASVVDSQGSSFPTGPSPELVES